jgi:hypothetical protein
MSTRHVVLSIEVQTATLDEFMEALDNVLSDTKEVVGVQGYGISTTRPVLADLFAGAGVNISLFNANLKKSGDGSIAFWPDKHSEIPGDPE